VEGEDHEGLVLLPGTDFQDGTIEADFALKPLTPPGVRFSGLCRGCLPRQTRCFALRFVLPEAGKLRGPGSGDAEPFSPVRRGARLRMVSACAVNGLRFMSLMRIWRWRRGQKCGSRWPARAARIYLNGSAKPSLVVDGLKGEDLHGAIGLFGYTNEEAYFSNVRITPAVPQNIKKRIRRRLYVADAIFKRRRRNGRVNGIAPRRKQRDRNMVRPHWVRAAR